MLSPSLQNMLQYKSKKNIFAGKKVQRSNRIHPNLSREIFERAIEHKPPPQTNERANIKS